MAVKRGDVYYANLAGQGGSYPVLVLQNIRGHKDPPSVIVAPIQAQSTRQNMAALVKLRQSGLFRDSSVILDQLYTVDRSCLLEYMGQLDNEAMYRIDNVLADTLGLPPMDQVCRFASTAFCGLSGAQSIQDKQISI